ncbi:MAG: sugar transferase, partial [Rickettsiales bacterium]
MGPQISALQQQIIDVSNSEEYAVNYTAKPQLALVIPQQLPNFSKPMQRFLKRAKDVVISGGALLVLSPVMLVIAALVKRDGGPAFFGHTRLGKNGESFRCLKFRSM